ncbi:flagellar biosynthesis protein FlhB [Pseudoroseomonas cervicalis]|uniref:EscU/YscU/HrcU family type III secretion system export apparatus switch protein n=1 Tax=Teichococcus cervicalis TaxID=204525 RepID=UPI00278A5CE1|nr:flagellar type III secretion system protein FlhB [Pseudoroseomonas cervicalis]MDQ1077586.1 flagellar biosynthetic protein FlhB [Pseudoroseomonas cervicalis]
MAEETGQEKTLDASPRKLQQARERGDLPMSREGSSFGLYFATLLLLWLGGGLIGQRFATVLLPLIEQPEAFLDLTGAGHRQAAQAVFEALALVLLPVFGLLLAGSLLPHLLQNNVVLAPQRLEPKLSHLSLISGFRRMFGLKGLFEFAKGVAKALTVAAACWLVAAPLLEGSAQLAALDAAAFPVLVLRALSGMLLAITLVAAGVAVIDIAFQRFDYARRQRMTHQEMREEMRSTDGDPHVKAALKRKRKQLSQRRMMADVPGATVVITNPTHFAVALRYERGKDVAPVCVAKGVDRMALRIRAIAQGAGVAVMEDRALARALHASVEVGQVIPPAHFEAVAKIIGIVWAQQGRKATRPAGPARPH